MNEPIRFAVVGLGHIAQVAVLPAFAHSERAQLSALVSGDATKLSELGKRYRVDHLIGPDEYDDFIRSGHVDAVFLCTPNHTHCEYTERSARGGVHVLCEKPMAPTEGECHRMIHACQEHDVRLMIAYRLHYEPANMRAVELATGGELGDVRIFNSTFCMDVKQGDDRLRAEAGGGTLFDIGVYCINASRYLFRAEPIEVTAFCEQRSDDPRFTEVDEMSSVTFRFPGNRLATFTTSFGTSSVARYQIVGTRGHLSLDPAYGYVGEHVLTKVVDGQTTTENFPASDQFAAEIDRFCEAVASGVDPEPDGYEGLTDVRLIRATYRSALEGRPISLEPAPRRARPAPNQALRRPPVEGKPNEVHATGPRRS